MSATVERRPSLDGDPLRQDGPDFKPINSISTSPLVNAQPNQSPTPPSCKVLDAEASLLVSFHPNKSTSSSLNNGLEYPAKSEETVKGTTKSSLPVKAAAPLTGDQMSTNSAVAMNAISAYTDAEALSKGIDPKDRPSLLRLGRQIGLRPGFATPSANTRKQGKVFTNYLRLNPPNRIWVYRLEMIRSQPSATTNAVLVEKNADRMALMPQIERHIPALQPGPTGTKVWVTDGDLIWTTVNVLNATVQQGARLVTVTHNPAMGVDLSYHNECGTHLTIAEVNIFFAFDLRPNLPLHQLMRYSPNVPFRQSQPEILLRGLNAFLTSHARSQNNTTLFTGGKKGYERVNVHAHPTPQLESNNLGRDLLRALRGFYLSARPGVDRFLVNINSISSPFFGVHQTLETVLISGSFASMSLGKKTSLTTGLLVELAFPFNGANASPQSGFRFVRGIGAANQICHRGPPALTVRDCFRTNANCLNRGTRATNVPATAPGVHSVRVAFNMQAEPTPQGYETYPADVLRIVQHQPFHGTMDGMATSNMINFAREEPGPSRARILGPGLNMFGFHPPQQSGLARFGGMSTGRDMLQIPALWLNPPTIRYYNERNPAQYKDVMPRQASWNLMDVRFAQTSTKIHELLYVNLSRLPDTAPVIARMKRELKEKVRSHGMLQGNLVWQENNQPAYPHRVRTLTEMSTPNFEIDIQTVLAQNRPTRARTPLVVALPYVSPTLYACLKRMAELRLGYNTVMFNAAGSNFNAQKASNIALKCSLKLSQAPHILPQSFRHLRPSGQASNTIVIGADVTHPGKGAITGCPSIAAVVGSTDDDFMHFPGSMRLQRNRKEYIIELGDMVKERLIDWAEKHGGSLPTNMLFYRDGVAETQYAKLRTVEVPQIQKAYNWAREFLLHRQNGGTHNTMLDATRDPWPTIANPSAPGRNRAIATEEDSFNDNTNLNENFNLTYVVVGKRHNTRFYATADADKIKPAGPGHSNHNVVPGLLVDQVITHPYNFDFYLQSHNPIAGTGRSAHYIVLQNDMDLSAAQMHQVVSLPIRMRLCEIDVMLTEINRRTSFATRTPERPKASRIALQPTTLTACVTAAERYLIHYLSNSLGNNNAVYNLPPNRNNATQTPLQYLDFVKDWLHDRHYYRPSVVGLPVGTQPPRKYGFTRRNPWHANLDDIMFYL